ncbi:PGF-CTERM sorting domain-containing protein [Halobacterium sp. R2-5]|uniref:PGF-CTERM sorting domain-containing protein n=1 Tax=Halobacterium sp. R2-5 TaxID=2715751 RepID=UPI0014200952|nr:PGF-CTERM sorting domain-containing protein [Halobacterium sp. R2-5]NIB99512.1 PGF-CTERM sorting domain-containing protein [Halobacterium sp. R2-5]
MRRVAVATVVVLLATQVAGAAAVQAPVTADADAPAETSVTASERTLAAGSAQSATIRKDIELRLTPDEPGAIGVTATYDVPDSVTSLRVNVPADARNVDSDSFTQTPDGYEWDGTTDPASIAFTLPANQTATGPRSPGGEVDGDYSFVDVGEWALVTVPQLRSRWSYRSSGGEVTIAEDVTIAGQGSTGGEIAYLGPVEEHTRTANGQTFTLAVPEHASLAASPEAVLDALDAASGKLHVGARDDDVWFAAAPTDADWGVRGVEYGGSDAWVVADARLDRASNVWFHEYVHTRQDYRTAESGRWTMEAAAEYYASLLSLRTDYVTFGAFETHLSYGERSPWRDAVLSQPGTWPSGANYVKGPLVWGEIDRQVRLATDSTETMSDVLYRLNQLADPVTSAMFLEAVLDVSSPEVEELANQYTNTRETPEMWTRGEHAEAFGTEPARVAFEVREYRVSGPFRNETFARPPTLYVGETVTVVGSVTNEGGQTGEYVATVGFEGGVLSEARGELEPGESAEVALREEVGAAGTYNVTGGRTTVGLDVREPANVSVSDLTVNESSVRPGGSVEATVTLSNPNDVPATGPVAVTVDGEEVATVDAALAPGESTTRTVTVTLADAGQYTIAAGDQSVTVGVGENETGLGIPGFGVPIALVAVLLAAVLASRAGRDA